MRSRHPHLFEFFTTALIGAAVLAAFTAGPYVWAVTDLLRP